MEIIISRLCFFLSCDEKELNTCFKTLACTPLIQFYIIWQLIYDPVDIYNMATSFHLMMQKKPQKTHNQKKTTFITNSYSKKQSSAASVLHNFDSHDITST